MLKFVVPHQRRNLETQEMETSTFEGEKKEDVEAYQNSNKDGLKTEPNSVVIDLDNPCYMFEEEMKVLQPDVTTYGSKESRRIIKNVIILCLAFLLLLIASDNMKVLGKATMITEMWCYIVTMILPVVSMFLFPALFIRLMTVKVVIIWSLQVVILNMVIQFYIQNYVVFVPVGFINEIFQVILWVSVWTYLCHIGHEFAKVQEDEEPDLGVELFFGIFFFFTKIASLSSTLLPPLLSYLFSSNGTNDSLDSPKTIVSNAQIDLYDYTTLEHIYAGVYVGLAIIGIFLIIIFLDPLSRYGEKNRNDYSCCSIFPTPLHLTNPHQFLLVPLAVWTGMELALFNSNDAMAIIRRDNEWGVKYDAIYTCYGVTSALSSLVLGTIIRFHCGRIRIPIIVLAVALNIGVIATYFLCEPRADHQIVLFVMTGLWGVANGIWQRELYAYCGILFRKNAEAAFSVIMLCQYGGKFLVTDPNLRTYLLYTLIPFLVVGSVGYFILEMKKRRKSV